MKKNVIEHTKCVLISSIILPETSHSKKSGAYDYKRYIGLHVKYPLLLSDFKES